MEASRSDRAALSHDVSEFLIELSIALHRYSMYPPGHPALLPAIESVAQRADALMHVQPSLAIGVGRRQLIVDAVSTDPNQPVLRRLADVLHRHHIGAITLMRGVDAQEIGEALQALATEPDRDGPYGLKPGAGGWPHLKLHPLTFDGLALVDEGSDGLDAPQRSAAPDLWMGLARAALALSDGPNDQVEVAPSRIAHAIDHQSRADAQHQAIAGYLVQIAHELTSASGQAAEELRTRTSRLIASLERGTLQRLVTMAGDRERRDQFVHDATHGLALDAVLQIVKATAEANGQTISHGLVRMLTKLAAHAERGSDLTRVRADAELREQVGRLLQDWRLEDPNPEAYGRMLELLSTTSQGSSPGPAWAVAGDPEPLHLVKICLEAGAFGPLADKAIDAALSAGQLSGLVDLLSSPPQGSEAAAETILSRLIRPESLKGMLAGDRFDLAGLDSLLPRLSVESYEPLLEALGASPNRAVRRKLLDLLGRTTVDITPLIIARLRDARWYVQRNMLMLLARSHYIPDNFSAVAWTRHPDARVRTEAVRLQLLLPHEREVAVRTALVDPDPRIVHIGLSAMRDACPPELVGRLVEIAVEPPDTAEDNRLPAVNALSRIRHPMVLDALLYLTDGGRSFLGRLKLPQKTPVLVAALRALAATWSDDPEAAAVLAAAARSSDPELRDAGTLLRA